MQMDPSLLSNPLAIIGLTTGLLIIQRFPAKTRNPQTVMAVAATAGMFVIVYLGGISHEAFRRYVTAENIAIEQAHTRVGLEGYEYIFEPNTQILIDKIIPNRFKVIASIVRVDYLPFPEEDGCGWVEGDICRWMKYRILYFHNPHETIQEYILYASIASLLTGAVSYYYFNIAQRSQQETAP